MDCRSSTLVKNQDGCRTVYRGKNIAVVVPAFNEEVLISETLEGIPDFVDRIYAISDGSDDSTFDIIVQRSKVDARVIPIEHKVNKGVGAALITGYKASVNDSMDITAIMAGDNQMDPKYLPSLLDPIIEGRADYSKGNRLFDTDYIKGMSTWRFLGNTILTILTKLSSGHYNIGDPQNGYTAMRNDVFHVIDPDSIFPWYGYCNDILMRLKVHKFVVVDVAIPARYGREKSTIPYPKYIARLSRLLAVNFILRLGMKKAVKHPHWPAMSFVTGGIMFVGGLVGMMTHPFEGPFRVFHENMYSDIILILLGMGVVLMFYGMIISHTSKKFIVPQKR